MEVKVNEKMQAMSTMGGTLVPKGLVSLGKQGRLTTYTLTEKGMFTRTPCVLTRTLLLR